MAISKRKRFRVIERANRRCQYCGRTDIPLQVEHIEPVSLGGCDEEWNLAAACGECNLGKSDGILGAANDIVRQSRLVAWQQAALALPALPADERNTLGLVLAETADVDLWWISFRFSPLGRLGVPRHLVDALRNRNLIRCIRLHEQAADFHVSVGYLSEAQFRALRKSSSDSLSASVNWLTFAEAGQ